MINILKSNIEASKRRYLDWWNGKGIVLTMWEHLEKADFDLTDSTLTQPPPAKDLEQFWFDPD